MTRRQTWLSSDKGNEGSRAQPSPEIPPTLDENVCITCDCALTLAEEVLSCNKQCHRAHFQRFEGLNNANALNVGALTFHPYLSIPPDGISGASRLQRSSRLRWREFGPVHSGVQHLLKRALWLKGMLRSR